MHLCSALRAPWLPQTFLIPVRQSGVHPDEARDALSSALDPARALLAANPEWQLHHMHDPNQDRLMVQKMAYFRVKRLRLGEGYETFLRTSLAPGATIFVVDCRLRWPTTHVGDRHYFQHGALGGAATKEFFEGSDRVRDFLYRCGSHRSSWDPPETDGDRPEAEWGFEPSLLADVTRLAERCGYQVRTIVFDEPEDLSPLVAELYKWWYARIGLPPTRLLVESFIMLDPWQALATASVPFWMVFNMKGSADRLERYLQRFGHCNEARLMLFAHGVESVGLAPSSGGSRSSSGHVPMQGLWASMRRPSRETSEPSSAIAESSGP